jgi:hypothetical protein
VTGVPGCKPISPSANLAMPVRLLRHRLCLALLCAVLGAGCASLAESWQAPEVAFAGLRLKEVTLARQTVILTLAVRNPNDRPLPIKAMTCRLQIDGNEVARGASTLDRQIPAFGDALVDLELEGNLASLIPQLPPLALKDGPLDWTVSGTATVADGFLILPYRYSGQVSARTLLSHRARR